MTTTRPPETEASRRSRERMYNEFKAREHQKTAAATKLKVADHLKTDTDVAALIARVDPLSERARAIPARLKALVEKRLADVKTCWQDPNLTRAGKEEKTRGIEARHRDEVAALTAEFEASRAGIEAALDRATQRPDAGVQAQLLNEMVRNRLSQRVQAQLSAAGGDHAKLTQRLQRLVDATPDSELTSLAEELTFQAQDTAFGGDLVRTFIAHAVTPRYEASFPPVQAAVLQIERDVAGGLSRIAASLAAASQPADRAVMALPGWGTSEVYPVGGAVVNGQGG